MSPLLAALAERIRVAIPGVDLRVEVTGDTDFLSALYASTRTEELAAAPWDAATKLLFLHEQFQLQYAHYRANYIGAEFLVIEREQERIGRIYLYRSANEIRLMDIALLPEQRCQGIGTALVTALRDLAHAQDCEITLHVEPNNPALKLYDRFGFALIENRGVYLFLGWRADASAPGQLNTTS